MSVIEIDMYILGFKVNMVEHNQRDWMFWCHQYYFAMFEIALGVSRTVDQRLASSIKAGDSSKSKIHREL